MNLGAKTNYNKRFRLTSLGLYGSACGREPCGPTLEDVHRGGAETRRRATIGTKWLYLKT
jgi:hypothetical protein